MWIYWATTLPATIATVVVWRIWIAESDEIMGFFRNCRKWIKTQWKKKTPNPTKAEP